MDVKTRNTGLYNFQTRIGTITAVAAFSGQYVQSWQDAAGEFVAPQIIRHHFSNVFDGMFAAATLEIIQMIIQKRVNPDLPLKPRPILCAAFALALGTGWEAYSATQPNRSFDFADTSLYAGSAMVYAVIGTRRRRKFEAQIKADEAAQQSRNPVPSEP